MQEVTSESKQREIDVIFLDIDGVLSPFHPSKESNIGWPKSCLKALDDIVCATGATIVLSSTWRSIPDACDFIIQKFKEYGGCLGRISRFAHMTDPTKHGNCRNHACCSSRRLEWHSLCIACMLENYYYHLDVRQWEIVDWIHRIAPSHGLIVRRWVALDDDESVLSDPKFAKICSSHVVQCKSCVGLTSKDAADAIKKLSGKWSDILPAFCVASVESQ